MKDVVLKADGLYLTNPSNNETMRISPMELWFIFRAAREWAKGDCKDANEMRYDDLMTTLDNTRWSRDYERKYA